MKRRSPQDALRDYTDREHSQIKHAILESYLERCLMIIGQHFSKIAYIDCFAGPWQSTTPDLSDTSPGIAIKTMATCDLVLKKKHHARTRLRSIFIEADVQRADQLDAYVQRCPSNITRPEVWRKSFENAIPEILTWLEPGEFAFVFVDPFGWKGIVDPVVLAPLLQRKNTELLINFMWNFLNLATGHEDQHQNLTAIFGKDWQDAATGSSEAKRVGLMSRYRQQLVQVGGNLAAPLRTAMLPVEYVDRRTIIFYLVYATHNATGLVVFREQAEEAANHQARLKLQHRLNKIARDTGQDDMFGATQHVREQHSALADLKNVWVQQFPKAGDEVVVDYRFMANLIEHSEFLLSDLQAALRELVREGTLTNLDAKAARPKNAVNYRKGERLKRLH
jgi:three-Cys-motif partner protein